MDVTSNNYNVFGHTKFSVFSLLYLAEELRGVSCGCDSNQHPTLDGFCWTIKIIFVDGVEWLFRSPYKYPDDEREKTVLNLLESEVATLRYIRNNSSIPVPEVYHTCYTALNPIEVPFILTSKPQGSAISMTSWDPWPVWKKPGPKEEPSRFLTALEQQKIIKQLGGITSQLSRLRFDKIGSVFEDEGGEYEIDTCLSPALETHGRHNFTDEQVNRGPFYLEREYYKSMISSFMFHVESLRMRHHVLVAPFPARDEYDTFEEVSAAIDRWRDFVKVGRKAYSGKNRLKYSIAGELLLEMLPYLARQAGSSNNLDARFPLHHHNLSAKNIFIDDDCNITCIVNWAFSTTVPLSTLLVTPSMPLPYAEPDPAMDAAFKAGFREDQIAHGEADASEAAPYGAAWDSGRAIWLFTRLVRLDSALDIHYLTELFNIVHGKDESNMPLLISNIQSQKWFAALGTKLARDDLPAREIAEKERSYFVRFGINGIDRLAVARKLTMIAAMNKEFVADKRLWKWLAKAVPLENPSHS
ncbi:hypothetical protein MMC22_004867 [Lobaria immixta]|nr:hypothetical protein [Lobaria immixta]